MSKPKCIDCGEDLKDTRAIERDDLPGVRLVAHCDNSACPRKWEWIDVTVNLLSRI